MIIAVLTVFGLCLGSFVNALVWRVHEQTKSSRKRAKELSIMHGRSMCVHCHHELAWYDLLPGISWLLLGGKCRYCHKPISWQYPVVELLTASLFISSYIFWPTEVQNFGILAWISFAFWLVLLTGFVALLVYDLKWMLLPNRIIYPLMAVAAVFTGLNILNDFEISNFYNLILSVIIAGGLFLILFQISDGRWIGGGDVKLGFLSGLVLADPYQAFLMLFLASTLGTTVVIPGLLTKKFKATSRIPFGPFLVVSTIVVKLFGVSVIEWYKRSLGV